MLCTVKKTHLPALQCCSSFIKLRIEAPLLAADVFDRQKKVHSEKSNKLLLCLPFLKVERRKFPVEFVGWMECRRQGCVLFCVLCVGGGSGL